MASETSVVVVGATGLVGGECVRLLLDAPFCHRLLVVARRPLPAGPRPAKLEQHLIEFERLDQHASVFAADQIVCALGTTIRQAGTREQFRCVDYDYPLAIARLGLAQGVRHFLLVSALGADPESRIFYNRVKGEIERDVMQLGYRSVSIFRPSLLLGARSRLRLGEEIAKRFAPIVPRRYKPVHARSVAAAIVRAAAEDAPGVHIIESNEMRASARLAAAQ